VEETGWRRWGRGDGVEETGWRRWGGGYGVEEMGWRRWGGGDGEEDQMGRSRSEESLCRILEPLPEGRALGFVSARS